jgi:hypothetical protein
MAVKIEWQPPLVPEERKRVQWEQIIRRQVGEVEDSLDVSLRFDKDGLRWKLDALAPQASGAQAAAQTRGRLVDALRATGKPVA